MWQRRTSSSAAGVHSTYRKRRGARPARRRLGWRRRCNEVNSESLTTSTGAGQRKGCGNAGTCAPRRSRHAPAADARAASSATSRCSGPDERLARRRRDLPRRARLAGYELSNNPSALGGSSPPTSRPWSTFLVAGGVLTDRFSAEADHRRRCDPAVADRYGGAALAIAGTLELWQPQVCAAVTGSATRSSHRALGSIVPEIVPRQSLAQATRSTSSCAPSRHPRPALAGVLIAVSGPVSRRSSSTRPRSAPRRSRR